MKGETMRFDDNELEIAIVTYNRSGFIKEWLEKCYESIAQRNISLSIYDSSTDGKTELFLKKDTRYKLNYVKIDSSENIGYKPMFPILNSHSKYVWVSGDSRYHDFDELDKKVFIHIKNDIDYICMQIATNSENDGKIYQEKENFLRDCFVSMTCIGLSIYKTSLFDLLKTNQNVRKQCDSDFRDNYAFSWLGYFLSMYSYGSYKTAFVVTKIYDIKEKEKKQVWMKRFLESWCQNVCELMDNIPDCYGNKEFIIEDTWKKMKYFTMDSCYKARISGGINKSIYEKYISNGMLNRLHTNIDRIRIFATYPEFIIRVYYLCFRIFRKVGKLFKFVDDTTLI